MSKSHIQIITDGGRVNLFASLSNLIEMSTHDDSDHAIVYLTPDEARELGVKLIELAVVQS